LQEQKNKKEQGEQIMKFSSFKGHQLIMENWRRFLKEGEEGGQIPFEEIQQIFDTYNFTIKDRETGEDKTIFPFKEMKADENTITMGGNYYIVSSPDSWGHVRDRHTSDEGIGSKFDKNLNLRSAIANLLKKSPNEAGQGKIKWLAMDAGQPVGIDNVKQGSPDEMANLPDVKISKWETVKVKYGESGVPTSHMSFIAADVGEAGGKKVLSMVTAFPGQNGAEVADRNDFAAKGYYFVHAGSNPNPEAEQTPPGEVNQ
jgi:hypothetical protein